MQNTTSITVWQLKSNIFLVIINLPVVILHLTDASSEWSQLWLPIPLWLQSNNSDSDPEQNTLSNQIGPVPCPKTPSDKAMCIPVVELISSSYIIYVNYSTELGSTENQALWLLHKGHMQFLQ